MFKKVLSLCLAALMLVGCLAAFSSCSVKDDGVFKIGLIMVGDETEGYTKAHMDGIKAAAKNVGLTDDQLIWAYKVDENNDCYQKAMEMVGKDCELIVSNSYGHQDFMAQAAGKKKSVNTEFVAMTGDYAAISGLTNFHNAFTRVYESRFVSGYVAGLKLAQMLANNEIKDVNYTTDGKIRIGYVGAFAYAEVVSGYTAFYLGVKAGLDTATLGVNPGIAMEVVYTDSWFSIEKEAEAARKLMADNCVIIGQHADSTGAPAAVEDAHKKGTYTNVYSVGYNVSMLEAAPTVALTSASNNWEVYYTYLFQAAKDKYEGKEGAKDIVNDWAEGYTQNAVAITALGTACAPGTQEMVDQVIAALKAGAPVFDTSLFTVKGEKVTKYDVDLSYRDWSNGGAVVYQGDTVNAIKTKTITYQGLTGSVTEEVTFFDESTFRSAPYFDLRIDGITELEEHIGAAK